MRRSNSNACKNIFSLTSKECVCRGSMLISDLDHKRLLIRVTTIKIIAVQIRVHLSLKIFHVYFNEAKFTDIIYKFKHTMIFILLY